MRNEHQANSLLSSSSARHCRGSTGGQERGFFVVMSTTKRKGRAEYMREYRSKNRDKVDSWAKASREREAARRERLGITKPAKYSSSKRVCTNDQKAKISEQRRIRRAENPELFKDQAVAAKARRIEQERVAEIALIAKASEKLAADEKRRAAAREWYSKNSERVSKKTSEYRKMNPEKRAEFADTWRSRRYGQTDRYDASEAAEKIRTLKTGLFGTCEYCRSEFPMKSLTIDHIKPLSKGGLHVASNLTLACRSCNSSKGAKILGVQTVNTTQAVGKDWCTRTGSNRRPTGCKPVALPLSYSCVAGRETDGRARGDQVPSVRRRVSLRS